jgi:hypothetical protein
MRHQQPAADLRAADDGRGEPGDAVGLGIAIQLQLTTVLLRPYGPAPQYGGVGPCKPLRHAHGPDVRETRSSRRAARFRPAVFGIRKCIDD